MSNIGIQRTIQNPSFQIAFISLLNQQQKLSSLNGFSNIFWHGFLHLLEKGLNFQLQDRILTTLKVSKKSFFLVFCGCPYLSYVSHLSAVCQPWNSSMSAMPYLPICRKLTWQFTWPDTSLGWPGLRAGEVGLCDLLPNANSVNWKLSRNW